MNKMMLRNLIIGLSAISAVGATQAAPINITDSYWSGWTQIADDDGVYKNGFVDPGWGGQAFDAEYLFYKIDGNTLSLGLQTGYDIIDGHVRHQGRDYYAGDLALSFNGSGYNYAIDFGLFTKDYYGNKAEADANNDGKDEAGLYNVTNWNNNIYFGASAPYAMDAGSRRNDAGFALGDYGSVGTDSFFRTASFDASSLGLGSEFDFDAHWTMSCGNDVVEGSAAVSVPEPYTLPLLGMSLFAIVMLRRRKED